jgi:transcriptional regulator with XRE-family HTH domain
MTLKEYLALPGNSATKLADAAGVSISTITRAANGDTIPNKDLMSAIFEQTGGIVTPNDFFGCVAAVETAPAAEAA